MQEKRNKSKDKWIQVFFDEMSRVECGINSMNYSIVEGNTLTPKNFNYARYLKPKEAW